jgi:nucleoside phosphorylase
MAEPRSVYVKMPVRWVWENDPDDLLDAWQGCPGGVDWEAPPSGAPPRLPTSLTTTKPDGQAGEDGMDLHGKAGESIAIDTVPNLLVITPLRIERAAVRRRLPGAMVLRSGMGAANARAAGIVAAGIPADAVAVAGFCGAVAEGLRAGDVVVASEVRGPEGVTVCDVGPVVAALEAMGIERISVGPIASADHVVHGAERGALAGQGALAADMESAWLAAAAAGRPLAVVRVVLDTPSREISRPLATLAGGVAAWRALRRLAPALARWARDAS